MWSCQLSLSSSTKAQKQSHTAGKDAENASERTIVAAFARGRIAIEIDEAEPGLLHTGGIASGEGPQQLIEKRHGGQARAHKRRVSLLVGRHSLRQRRRARPK